MLLIGTLIAAALIALALFAVKSKPAASTTSDKAANFNLANVPFEGKADAPVTVVAVEDFKCPACKGFQDSAAGELKTKYVDTGKVKWHTLIWPFIAAKFQLNPDDSFLAAQAAQCVYDQKGNEGFSVFKDILFRAQGPEDQIWASKDALKTLAANVEGLDSGKFGTCLDTDATLARVQEQKKMAEAAGVNSTPSIFVNGKLVNVTGGYVKDISAAIDQALK